MWPGCVDNSPRKFTQSRRAQVFFSNLNKLTSGPSSFRDYLDLQESGFGVDDFRVVVERSAVADQIE